jgi:type IV secretory pathway VirB10-like protein
MAGVNPPLDNYIKIPTTFAGQDRRLPAPEPPPPLIPPLFASPPPQPPAPGGDAPREEKPPPAATPAPAPAAQPQHPRQPTPPSKWLFADVKQGSGVQEPPFPVPKDEAQGQGQGEAAGLFPKAVWARPLDPTKVLYAQQVINGVLASNVHSQHAGIIRILVTEQVEDRWGQGNVLIPQYTVLLAKSDKVEFGQERLGISITAAEFPDGTRAVFKGQAGDAGGALGLPGDVDNRWGNIIASAGISALLSIGSRIPAGNTQGYFPSLGQEVSRDVAQSVNQAGQRVVQRELDVSPIIRLKYGDPVSVQLLEPISFQTPPVITTK